MEFHIFITRVELSIELDWLGPESFEHPFDNKPSSFMIEVHCPNTVTQISSINLYIEVSPASLIYHSRQWCEETTMNMDTELL